VLLGIVENVFKTKYSYVDIIWRCTLKFRPFSCLRRSLDLPLALHFSSEAGCDVVLRNVHRLAADYTMYSRGRYSSLPQLHILCSTAHPDFLAESGETNKIF
jgi:hypothetical protein